MKDYKMKSGKTQCIDCDAFYGGIDLDGHERKIEPFRLHNSVNLFSKGGTLRTRPVIVPDMSLAIPEYSISPLTVTKTPFYYNGNRYNFGYYCKIDQSFNGTAFKVLLFSEHGDYIPFGEYDYLRLEGYNQYVENATFFTGKQNGQEYVFCIAKVYYGTGNERYDILKLTPPSLSWNRVDESSFYIPTVMENGHGEEYDPAILDPSDEAAYPEQLNRISRYFVAKYSSDATSWKFVLPIKNLDISRSINLRFYLSDSEYVTFLIYNGIPGHAVIGEREFYASADFATGEIFFTSEGVAKPLPLTAKDKNNIVITAARSENYNPDEVLSSKYIFNYNSHYYFFGNAVNKNEGYCSKPNNPLYFPTGSKVTVGSTDEVTGIGAQNDKVIVFKKNEIYKITTAASSTLSKAKESISGEGEYFLADTMRAETISTLIGCIDGASISSISGRLIWLGSDKKVYTLETTTYGNEKNIYCISGAAQNLLDTIDADAFHYKLAGSFVQNGCYFLNVENKLFMCDCKIREFGFPEKYANFDANDSVAWSYHELPENYRYTFAVINENIVMTLTENDDNVGAPARLKDGSVDTVVFGSEEILSKTLPIKSLAETKEFDFDSPYNNKLIKGVLLDVEKGDCFDVEMISDKKTVKKHFHAVSKRTSYRLNVGSKPVKTLKIRFTSSGEFSALGLKILYETVNL